MFIVVEPILDYDYVDEIKFIAKFDTYEDASFFVAQKELEWSKSCEEYERYLSDYAKGLLNSYVKSDLISFGIPEHWFEITEAKGWSINIRSLLRNHEKYKFPNFYPPETIRRMDCRIVEVPE